MLNANHLCHGRRVLVARVTLATVFVAALFLSPLTVQAAQGDQVYFAGVAFTSNAANLQQTYPHAAKALSGQGYSQFNQAIRRQLQSPSLPVQVVFDALGSIKDSSKSTALALGIDGESTSIEHIGDVYKLRVEISAQALFFDFKEKQVLGGFPFTLEFIDASATPPTDADVQKAYDGMLFGAAGRHSLASEFVKTLAQAQIPNASNKHLRVTSATLGPKALTYVQQAAPQLDIADTTTQVAQSFGVYLGANQHISILPYSSNQALGSSMAARFIEGDAYQLKIPEADYEIHLNVAGFKKIDQGRSEINAVFVYGAFVDVAVTEPLSGKVYFSQRIKQGATKTVPATQKTIDDWSPARESLLLLFDNFTRAMSSGHGEWAKSAMSDEPQAKTQLSSLSELVQSCR